MRIAGTWNPAEVTDAKRENAHQCLITAWEQGYTLFDHADIYARGACETLHGEVLKKVPAMRKDILIATKCGIRFGGDPQPDSPHRYDFSAEHILWSCDQSLQRLGIETIDIYQLHRPDLLMNPAEIAEAFTKLKNQGKVRFFGVSNFMPSFVSALQSAGDFPLLVNQVEIHLGRLAPFYDGTLDQCIEKNITPLSWSPLAGGLLGDRGEVKADHPRFEVLSKLIATLDEVAIKYGVGRGVLALAWLLKHPSGIIPIVGSANPANIKASVAADSVDLSREDWYRILVAARGENLP